MHLPEIDKYAHLNSPFHSWDARIKLISFCCLIVVIAFLPDLPAASLALTAAIIMLTVSRIPFIFVLKQLRGVFFFLALFFIIMPLTVSGESVMRMGVVTVSEEGLRLSALIALRAVSICLIIFPMVGTMKFHHTLKALKSLRVPDMLVQMIMFTYRYIFVMLEEMERMSTAARSRLFRRNTDMRTLKTTGNLVGMLFVRGFGRTQRVYDAMVSRGYSGKLKIENEFVLKTADFFKAFLIMITACVLLLVRYRNG